MEIKEPTLDQKDRLKEFYKRVYRPDYILADDRFLNWWLHDNPFYEGEGYSCKVAVEGGEYVGHIAYIPIPLWSGGTVYRGAWGSNFIVDERFRGQGIGRKLHEAVNTEVDAFLDIGANEDAEAFFQKMKSWTLFGKLHRAVGVLDDTAIEFNKDGAIFPNCKVKDVTNKPGKVREIKRFDERVDRFWERIKSEIGSASERKSLFLNWRYADHPYFDYKIFVVEKGEEIEGFAVVRLQDIAKPACTLLRITEFFATEEARQELLAFLISYAQKSRISFIDFFLCRKKVSFFF